MTIELATCKTCGHIVSKEWTGKRYQWKCDTCNKYVRPFWTENYKPVAKPVNPALTEPYEPLDGLDVEIDLDAFQERMNRL